MMIPKTTTPPFWLHPKVFTLHLQEKLVGWWGRSWAWADPGPCRWSDRRRTLWQCPRSSTLSCPLSCCLTPCRPPGHWAEPGIARKLVVTRRRKLPSFPSGQNPDLLTRLLTHSSEEIEISHRARRGKMTKTCWALRFSRFAPAWWPRHTHGRLQGEERHQAMGKTGVCFTQNGRWRHLQLCNSSHFQDNALMILPIFMIWNIPSTSQLLLFNNHAI